MDYSKILIGSTYNIYSNVQCLGSDCRNRDLKDALFLVLGAYQAAKITLYQSNGYKILKQSQLHNVPEPNFTTAQKNNFIEKYEAAPSATLKNDASAKKIYERFKGVNSAGRIPWNGYTNIFKANADEILEATNRIKNHRILQNAGTNGNYGYLEGTIGNITKNGEMIRSGAADDITEVFDAVPVNSQQVIGGEGAWMRTTDSEFKMLNRLANELNAVKGQNYPLITGELKIISERPYCPSCQGVIQQFHEMFPNVKLILVDGAN